MPKKRGGKVTAQQEWELYASQRGYVVKANMQTIKTDITSWTAWINFLAGYRAAIRAARKGE